MGLGTDNQRAVDERVEYMGETDIEHALCLLEGDELDEYEVDLFDQYQETFGEEQVYHVPIPDYTTVSPDTFWEDILPFLRVVDELVFVQVIRLLLAQN